MLVLFFFSGATALVYEVVWQRMLILVFGNTTYASTTVVASFLGGMAAGSFVFGRFADRHKSPLSLYAYLEVGIAAFAVLSPLILSVMPAVYVGLYRSLPAEFPLFGAVRVCLSFLVLLIPSFLMGGTLPVISRFFIKRIDRLGWGIGALYGLNTLGGVVGAFSAAFLLLTWIGVNETIYLASAFNALIAGVALVLGRFHQPEHAADEMATSQAVEEDSVAAAQSAEGQARVRYVPYTLLAVYGVSGFCALAYEILWTRVLVFFLDSSTYAFATMLTTFLIGLGLGSLIFGRLLDWVKRPLLLLAVVQLLIGISAMLSVWEIGRLWVVLGFLEPKIGGSWVKLMGVRYAGAFYLMAVPTILLGVVFPLAGKIYAENLKNLGRRIGTIWAVNAVGWIAGAFVAGLALIPLVGITKSIMIVGTANISLGVVVAYLNGLLEPRFRWVPVAMVAVLAGAVVATSVVESSKLQPIQPGEELIYYNEDATASAAVVQKFDVKTLMVNGREEVPTTYNALRTFHMLGHLPLMLHRDPTEVLVVSFGAGVASGAVAEHDLRRIDIVEIHGEALEASNLFLQENQSVLDDPRVKVIVDDGRNYMLRTTKQYDVITSDATHPLGGDSWVLYTREFYQLCKSRLKPNGLMAQWLPIHMLAPEDYKSIVRTFQSVYPNTSLWYTNDYTLMLGASEEFTIDFALLTERFEDERVLDDLKQFHLDSPLAFLSTFVMGKDSLAKFTEGVEINSDNHPFVQPPRRRSEFVPAPENLLLLEESIESVFPLLSNMGDQAETVREDLGDYLEAQRHVIRGNFFKSVGARTREAREYQMALNVKPSDGNARELLKSVTMFR